MRISPSRLISCERSSETNSSAVLVEWPIVQTRLVGIDQFAFDGGPGKERASSREIRLELLLVLASLTKGG